MSTSPSGTVVSSSSLVSACSRWARSAPRRWMPTSATCPSGSSRRSRGRSARACGACHRGRGRPWSRANCAPSWPHGTGLKGRRLVRRSLAARAAGLTGRRCRTTARRPSRGGRARGQRQRGRCRARSEAGLLHHPPRGGVVGQREGDDLASAPSCSKAGRARRASPARWPGPGPSARGRSPSRPRPRRPATNGVLQAAPADHLAGRAVAQQPQPEAVALPVARAGAAGRRATSAARRRVRPCGHSVG